MELNVGRWTKRLLDKAMVTDMHMHRWMFGIALKYRIRMIALEET